MGDRGVPRLGAGVRGLGLVLGQGGVGLVVVSVVPVIAIVILGETQVDHGLAQRAGHRSRCILVVSARGITLLSLDRMYCLGGRRPRTALPTRRCVAPGATAASRSPLIPAETSPARRVPRPQRRRRPRPAGRRRRPGPRPAAPPPSPRAAPGPPVRPPHPPAPAPSWGSAPPRPGSPSRLTWTRHPTARTAASAPRPSAPQRSPAGRPNGPGRRSGPPSRPCSTAAARRSASAARRSRQAATLPAASWSRLSPTSRTPEAGEQPDVVRPGRSSSPPPGSPARGPGRPRRRRRGSARCTEPSPRAAICVGPRRAVTRACDDAGEPPGRSAAWRR